MGWGALASAASSAVSGGSGILGSILSYNSARDANQSNINENAKAMQFSADQAEQARAFDERMSNTAFQRATVDMKAAGLNPLLAAGSQASSPTSPSPQGSAASINAVPSYFSGISSSAADTLRMLQDFSESRSRIKLNSDLGDQARANAGLSKTTTQAKSAEAYVETLIKRMLQGGVNSAIDLKRKYWDGKSLNIAPRGVVGPGNAPDQDLKDLYGAGGYE